MTEPERGARVRTAVLGPGLPGSPGPRRPQLARPGPAQEARHAAADGSVSQSSSLVRTRWTVSQLRVVMSLP